MNCRHVLLAAAAAGLLISHDCGAFAQDAAAAAKPLPFVSPIFGDDMVLQRDKVDTIWGWSEPGDNVRVQIGDNTETRESQAITTANVPNTCLAVTIDTGDPDNIHAKDKLPVGERLAYCALAKYYGRHVVYSGPILETVERLPGSIRLHFTHTDGGLVVKGDKLEEFSIAGDDRKWHWADTRIEGDAIVVSSPSVPNPKEARYAWQSNPAATLFNGAGLPAAPFRTDTWPGMTQGVRPY
jgi:hypothetical protein